MKTFAILMISLNFGTIAMARAGLLRDLPSKDFNLVESTPSALQPKFQSESTGEQYRLTSNISPTWERGLLFDSKDRSLSVQGLGAGPLLAKANGYVWSVQDSGDSFRKLARFEIFKSPEGCRMTWDFLVEVEGRQKLKEKGTLAYSCSSGSLDQVAQMKPGSANRLSRADIFPEYEVTTPGERTQIDRLLASQAEELNACISRNINRPATLKDENRYSGAPNGYVSYRLSMNGEKLEAAPLRTADDARMDSCVMDIVKRINAKSLSLKTEKYLVFNAQCRKNAELRNSPYDCTVTNRVYDEISH